MVKYSINLMLISLLLFGMQCQNNEPIPGNPIDLLPPITQTGENTFGCLFNGEAYVVTNSNFQFAIYQQGILQFGGGPDGTSEIGMRILDKMILAESVYQLDTLNPEKQGFGFYVDIVNIPICIYDTKYPITGTVHILHFDNINFIISGTFQFDAVSIDCQDTVHITDGRFDMKYAP